MRTETRIVWVPVEEAPEGWRFLHNDISSTDSRFFSLWTAAPKGAQVPWDYECKWIESLPHNEQREVGEWERVMPANGS